MKNSFTRKSSKKEVRHRQQAVGPTLTLIDLLQLQAKAETLVALRYVDFDLRQRDRNRLFRLLRLFWFLAKILRVDCVSDIEFYNNPENAK